MINIFTCVAWPNTLVIRYQMTCIGRIWIIELRNSERNKKSLNQTRFALSHLVPDLMYQFEMICFSNWTCKLKKKYRFVKTKGHNYRTKKVVMFEIELGLHVVIHEFGEQFLMFCLRETDVLVRTPTFLPVKQGI